MRSRELYEIRERVIRELRRLRDELGAEMYLFGSFARGTHLLNSDVDVIVVSERFRGMDVADRVALVRLRLPRDLSFDIVPLTPEELKEKLNRSALIREASKYWLKV